jgi:hypothetical protein
MRRAASVPFDHRASPRYPRQNGRRTVPIKRLALILSTLAASSSAFAAGIDSRSYTCASLQALVMEKGYVFISRPAFGDFVVSNISYCSGEGSTILQRRSVATADNPECLVNYCYERIMDGRTD